MNVGTRFIASDEAELSEGYKACVLAARSNETVRASFINDLVPPASEGAYATAPRVVLNAFVAEWLGREVDFQSMRPELAEQMRAAMHDGTVHEFMVIAGEAAGAIDEVLPAAQIVRKLVTEAEEVLRALTPT